MDFSKIICAIKNSVAEQWNSVEKMAYIQHFCLGKYASTYTNCTFQNDIEKKFSQG
jgi:hypothetical protein